jgi:hypothetical protein
MTMPSFATTFQLYWHRRQCGIMDARGLHPAALIHMQGPCQRLPVLPAAYPASAPAPASQSLTPATTSARPTQPS